MKKKKQDLKFILEFYSNIYFKNLKKKKKI
jgi:hypothetical protein